MPESAPDKKRKIRELANGLAKARDSDILIFNYGLDPGLDYGLFRFLRQRPAKKKNLLLFLTTEGGDADAAPGAGDDQSAVTRGSRPKMWMRG